MYFYKFGINQVFLFPSTNDSIILNSLNSLRFQYSSIQTKEKQMLLKIIEMQSLMSININKEIKSIQIYTLRTIKSKYTAVVSNSTYKKYFVQMPNT